MISLPAGRLGLPDRGIIKAGMRADVVVFDLNSILDRSTMTQPMLEPAGIWYVFVNGVVVVDEGEVTVERPGAILRHALTAKTGQ